MWVEELTLENIKCFEKITLRCGLPVRGEATAPLTHGKKTPESSE
jgi:ribosomal protein S13